jgi:hypothetical protein
VELQKRRQGRYVSEEILRWKIGIKRTVGLLPERVPNLQFFLCNYRDAITGARVNIVGSEIVNLNGKIFDGG